jgi:hypothetical protein
MRVSKQRGSPKGKAPKNPRNLIRRQMETTAEDKADEAALVGESPSRPPSHPHRVLARRIFISLATVFLISGIAAVATDTAFLPAFASTMVGVLTGLIGVYLERTEKGGRHAFRRLPAILIVACLVVAGITIVRPSPESTEPDVKLRLVDYKFGPGLHQNLESVNDETSGYLNETDNYVKVNLRVAIENREKKPLHGVRIELSYSPNVDVTSDGNRKVDTADGRSVYEHSLGTLEPGQPYYAMNTPDELNIPLEFKHQEFCYLDEKQMPVCTVLVWSDDSGDHELDCMPVAGSLVCITSSRGEVRPVRDRMDFRVFSDKRPTMTGSIDLTFEPGEAVQSGDAGPKVLEERKDDESWDSLETASQFGPIQGQVLDSWTETLGEQTPVKVAYKKVRSASGETHQELYVNDVLRKALIGRDNWVGAQITNIDDNPDPDVRKSFARFYQLNWNASDFRTAYK